MPGARILAALILAAALIPSCPALSGAGNDTKKTAGQLRTFSFYVENDMMGGTDEHYTNAVKLTYLSKNLADYSESDLVAQYFPRLIPLIKKAPFVNDPGRLHNVGLSLGQDIYTPRNTRAEEMQEDDRPYAGWTYASLALHAKNATVLNTFETSLGVVGPAAGGEFVQNNWHDLIGKFRSKGWKHQLGNEPGLLFTWQRSTRAWVKELENNMGLDFIPHVGACLGNVHTYANMGGEVHFGYRLPSNFGSPLIRPGGVVGAPSDKTDTRVSGGFGWRVFAGVDGRAVGRNIFLDGNSWEDKHRVTKKHFVADVYGGLSVQGGSWSATYTHVFRTEEFDGQKAGQIFGSLNLAYSF